MAIPGAEVCLTGERSAGFLLSLIMLSARCEFNGHIPVASNALVMFFTL